MLAGGARADSINEAVVSGIGTNILGQLLDICADALVAHFPACVTVDVASGTSKAADVTFPGLAVFNNVGILYPD